jgi:DNA-binding MurR/RpiR family transcriptional regulator
MLAESDLSGSDEPTESELSKAVGVSQATVSRAFKKIRALVNKTGKTT